MPAPLRPCGLLVVLRVNWPITVTGRHAAGGAGVHEEAPRLTEQATLSCTGSLRGRRGRRHAQLLEELQPIEDKSR
jgi:hypothetical protein